MLLLGGLSEEDWDVEAEIARELQELDHAADLSYSDDDRPVVASSHSSSAAVPDDDAAAAPVEALLAALSAREQLADKLSITLQELHSLPQQLTTSAAAPATASAEQVSAAVAALGRLPATADAGQPAPGCDGGIAAAKSCCQAEPAAPQAHHSTTTCIAAQQPGPADAHSNTVGLGALQQDLTVVRCQHNSSETPPPVQQPLQADACCHSGDQPFPAADCAGPALAATSSKAAPVETTEETPASAPRPQLSPPRTPNTEDKRQHAAAALGQAPHAPQHLQPWQQAGVTAPGLDGEASDASGVSQAPSTAQSVGAGATAQALAAAAAAAAAAVAAEQAAAEQAAAQRLQEQAQLQQVLQQQTAAASARQAAQAAIRQQLQQQAAAAAVSYMAAWRIARAWQAYRSSPAHAAKLAAVVALQSAVRGASARRMLLELRQRQQLLSQLQAAEASGRLESLEHAAATAAAAGLAPEAEQALQRFQAASTAAARDLQHAAEAGTHAAYMAASAAAARFSTLSGSCGSWATRFQHRQQAAVQALQAAVLTLPLPQVQCAVDAALELGVPGKDLAAALEATRARDDAALSRLAAAVRALSEQGSAVLTQLGTGAAACAGHAAPVTPEGDSTGTSSSSGGSSSSGSVCFDLGGFEDAVAACRQYGKAEEASAAEGGLRQCRQQTASQLAEAAVAWPCAGHVQQLLSWADQVGGLQQVCAAAADRLAQRQRQLVSQLQQALATPDGTADAVRGLLRQAEQLGVPGEALAAAQQHLQQQQAAAQQQCWEAAKMGSLQVLQQAVDAASKQGVGAQTLQQCWGMMQGRQQEAAGRLAGLAAALCAAVQAGSGSSEALQELSQQPQQPQQGRTAGCLDSQLLALQEQAAECSRLGLQTNVVSAVQAVAHAMRMQVTEGSSRVASCILPLDSAWAVHATPVPVSVSTSHQPQPQPPAQQQPCLWEEGTWQEPSWVQDAGAVRATLPAHTQLAAQHEKGASQAAAVQLGGAQGCQQLLHGLPGLAPALQLQQQWAANLQAALDCQHGPQQAADPSSRAQQQQQVPLAGGRPSPHHQQEQNQKQPPQQQEQQEQASWLQKLLAANAAAPLEQLTQLDLSLEQLPGLHGLDALCPQLTSLAVNMNGLGHLQGLQRCSGLVHLSAQDNRLRSLPDTSCHPQLTCLLLDGNELGSIAPMHSSSSSRGSSSSSSVDGGSGGQGLVPHRCLETLSLSSNKLTSICGPGLTAPPRSGNCSTAAGHTAAGDKDSRHSSNGSSSSCGRPAGSHLHSISSWLPALQVLRLSGNQLQDVCGLEGCTNLRVLGVSRNRLTSLQGLAGCHLLQQLDASDNLLTSFPAHLHLPLLQRLNLSCNALSTWPALPPLPHLAHLSLADNQLQQLPALHGCLQLTALDLGFNQLQDLGGCIAALQTAPMLQDLQLHDNAFLGQYQHQQELSHHGQGAAGWQLFWPAAGAGGAGQGLGAAAAAAARAEGLEPFEAWYRRVVASGLPWLLKLDGDEVQPSERLPGWRQQDLQELLHPPLQQQQEQQQQQLVNPSVQLQVQQGQQQGQLVGPPRTRAHAVSVAVATGRLLARDSLLSSLLMQHLRSGCVAGLGCSLQPAAAAGSSSFRGRSHAAVCVATAGCMQLLAASCAAQAAVWLPHSACQTCMVQPGRAAAAAAAAGVQHRHQLPCCHLQQAHQQRAIGRDGCRSGGAASGCGTQCSTHTTSSSSSSSSSASAALPFCSCPAWLLQAEGVWCFSTHAWLVEMQATQRATAAASHRNSSCSSSSLHSGCPTAEAAGLARQQLLQLQQQACCQHQQQLVERPELVASAKGRVTAAAVLLQSCWRARSARQQFRQQLAAAQAAVALQSLWRGRTCRQLAAAARRQQREQAAQAAAAAAVKIQAALRGHKMRQRLKAALAAARSLALAAAVADNSNGHLGAAAAAAASAVGQQLAAGASSGQLGSVRAAAAAVAATPGDEDWELPGLLLPELSALQPGLWDDLLAGGEAATTATMQQHIDTPAVNPQQQQPPKGPPPGTASSSHAPAWLVVDGVQGRTGSAVSAGKGLGSATPDGSTEACMLQAEAEADASAGADGVEGGAAGPGRLFEARITALMAEWGFSDRATAEAYYRRQKHTLKAVAKHKREQQLKDPSVRLKRLQAQMGSHSAAAAPAAPAAAAASAVHAGSGNSRACSKQPSTQQRCSAAGSMSGAGCSSSRRDSRGEHDSSCGSRRLSKQLSCTTSGTGGDRGPPTASLAKSVSQKQHQALSLPSLLLPSISKGVLGCDRASGAGGSSSSSSSSSSGGGGDSGAAVPKPGGLARLQRL